MNTKVVMVCLAAMVALVSSFDINDLPFMKLMNGRECHFNPYANSHLNHISSQKAGGLVSSNIEVEWWEAALQRLSRYLTKCNTDAFNTRHDPHGFDAGEASIDINATEFGLFCNLFNDTVFNPLLNFEYNLGELIEDGFTRGYTTLVTQEIKGRGAGTGFDADLCCCMNRYNLFDPIFYTILHGLGQLFQQQGFEDALFFSSLTGTGGEESRGSDKRQDELGDFDFGLHYLYFNFENHLGTDSAGFSLCSCSKPMNGQVTNMFTRAPFMDLWQHFLSSEMPQGVHTDGTFFQDHPNNPGVSTYHDNLKVPDAFNPWGVLLPWDTNPQWNINVDMFFDHWHDQYIYTRYGCHYGSCSGSCYALYDETQSICVVSGTIYSGSSCERNWDCAYDEYCLSSYCVSVDDFITVSPYSIPS